MTMSVDYSLMGGVPQAEPGIQNPLPQNNVATPVSGYEDSPLIKELNKRSYENHDEIHGPVVKSIMQAQKLLEKIDYKLLSCYLMQILILQTQNKLIGEN